MRIFEINNTDNGSTGNIMLNIARVARAHGHEVITASKYTRTSILNNRQDPYHIYIGGRIGNTIHRYWAWMTDLQDTGAVFSTISLVRKIRKFKPDVVHLHDVVGWYINIDILFTELKEMNVPVVWTFHDCWAFTGRCIYFDALKCDLWKSGCGRCPTTRVMPHSWWFDLSAWNWRRKRRLFTGIKNLTIITPSQWLANFVGESFLSDYPVKIINNGIDLTMFKPTKGELYDKLRSDGKKIILGVAGTWSARKGLNDILRLSIELNDKYKIVLVGLDPEMVRDYPNITAFKRTDNLSQLAELYTAGDVLINPTYEDNFPTVNLESMACGTPVVTYKTGGSPESLSDKTGKVVPQGDYESLRNAILSITSTDKSEYSESCILRSKKFDMNARFNDYIDLFESLI